MSPQSRTDPDAFEVTMRPLLAFIGAGTTSKASIQADSKHHRAHGNSQSGLAQFPDKPLVLLAWVFQYPNTPQNVLLPSNHLLEIMLHIGRLARVSFLGLLQLFQMLGQSGHMLGMATVAVPIDCARILQR